MSADQKYNIDEDSSINEKLISRLSYKEMYILHSWGIE